MSHFQFLHVACSLLFVCYCNFLYHSCFPKQTPKGAAFLEVTAVLLAMCSAVKVSTTNHEKGGGGKKESPQAVPGTTKIESLLHALLLQFDLLIKGTKKYYTLQAKWVMWNQKKAALKEMRRLKFQKNGASNGVKIMRKSLHLLGVDMSCVSPLCISLRTAG